MAQSKNELELGAAVAKVGTAAAIPLTLSTTDQVQGFVAAFDWDSKVANGLGAGAGLDFSALSESADQMAVNIGANFMVVGIVLDTDGKDATFIPPGNDILLATARITCAATEGSSPLHFNDNAYPAASGGPNLENIVVVGGLSIGDTEGLTLTDGSIECLVGLNRFYIEPGAENTNGDCGAAKVLMENREPVEGYVVALCHDNADLTLSSITMGAAATAAAADFQQADLFPTGGTLGVVIDLTEPFTDNTIPVGDGHHIATFNYCCRSVPTAGSETTPLTFCNNQLGSPLKENVMVSGGLSISPVLQNGIFTCKPGIEPVENCNNGIDDDLDGDIDEEDSDCQQAFICGTRAQLPVSPTNPDGKPNTSVQASIGDGLLPGTEPAEVCFFIKSPEDNASGHAQRDHIQGFSMALSFCCDMVSAREAFDIEDTILEAIGAEFVSIQVDNPSGPLSDEDSDCEIIIGVLVDALPPFDGQTIPPLPNFQRVGCVQFDVNNDPAACGECCGINFADGAKGRGKVPIKNLISVENKSLGPITTNCEICLVGQEKFFRGDCNFMPMGSMSVDIADAAAVVSALFLTGSWKFEPPCKDACDCNDDGRLDLADAICILQYLFQFGRVPPAPGPGIDMSGNETPAGTDNTPDKLDCAAGTEC